MGSGWLTLPTAAGAEEAVAAAAPSTQRYKIGVCDWMILKRQKLGAFQLTKDIGADGVEVDMGSLGQRETFENALADEAVRKQFLDTARELGLEICSLAMSGFYAQSFAERPTVPRMLQDCIDTMKADGGESRVSAVGRAGRPRAASGAAAGDCRAAAGCRRRLPKRRASSLAWKRRSTRRAT